MKAKLFLMPLLLIIFLSACVKKQAKAVELPAEEVIEEIVAEPLPPINERLNGTVWVYSDEMWEDIPIGQGKTTYTFTENEFCRVDSQFDFLEHETKITLRILIPYSIVSNNTIKDEYYSNEEFLSTITVYADHIIENDIYTENSQKVKNGEAYADEIIRTKKFYPYTAELRDMDYTKDLQLDGTEWILYAWEASKGTIDKYGSDGKLLYDYGFNLLFDNDKCEKGKTTTNYIVTQKYIIIDNWGYNSSSGYAVIQNNKLIISASQVATYGYLLKQ